MIRSRGTHRPTLGLLALLAILAPIASFGGEEGGNDPRGKGRPSAARAVDCAEGLGGTRRRFTSRPAAAHHQPVPNALEGRLPPAEALQGELFPLKQLLQSIFIQFDGTEELRWFFYFLTGHLVVGELGDLWPLPDEDMRGGGVLHQEWADQAIEEQYPTLVGAVREAAERHGFSRGLLQLVYEDVVTQFGELVVMYPARHVRAQRAGGAPTGDPWGYFLAALKMQKASAPAPAQRPASGRRPRAPQGDQSLEGLLESLLGGGPLAEARRILGIGPEATFAEARGAYRELAKRWHPDHNRGNERVAGERFKQINSAWQTVKDHLGPPGSRSRR